MLYVVKRRNVRKMMICDVLKERIAVDLIKFFAPEAFPCNFRNAANIFRFEVEMC